MTYDTQTIDVENYTKQGWKMFYRRVSSESQNLDRQKIPGIKFDRVFDEKYTGTRKDRPELKTLLNTVRENDVVYFYSMDRAARSLNDLQKIITAITSAGGTARFYKEQLTFDPNASDAFATFQMQMIGAIAELENAIRRERQIEGIEAAKGRGVYKQKVSDKDRKEIKRKYASQQYSYADLSKEYNVSRVTIGRIVKE